MRDKDGEKKQGELKVRRRNWFIGRIYNAITNMLFQEDRVRRQMAEMFLYDRWKCPMGEATPSTECPKSDHSTLYQRSKRNCLKI